MTKPFAGALPGADIPLAAPALATPPGLAYGGRPVLIILAPDHETLRNGVATALVGWL
jgi:hypothetical protein